MSIKVQDDETLAHETSTIASNETLAISTKKNNRIWIFIFVLLVVGLASSIGYMSFMIHTDIKYNNEITPVNPYYAIKVTINNYTENYSNTDFRFNMSSRQSIQYFDSIQATQGNL